MKTFGTCFGGLILSTAAVHAASGVLQDGIGSRSMALGGADVGQAEGPLSSFGINPAASGWITRPTLDLGFVGGFPEGSFSDGVNDHAQLSQDFGALPNGAFGMRLAKNVGLVVGVVPDALLSAKWHYFDPPGGADGKTTYGFQTQKSEILVLRSGFGVGWAITPKLSIGGGFSAIYNENTLEAPYVFQTQPALKGVKTLLDLNTTGWGWNGQAGLLYQPVDTLQLGVAYKGPTSVHGHGEASGNAGVQFGNLGLGTARPDFHYNAEVDTDFPQMVSAGASWLVHPNWRLVGQVDWINWSDAFDTLPVILTQGNNADLNKLVGANSLQDDIPLNWRDQFVYRVGVEYAILRNLFLRTGYSYGRNPVPANTLTPLTAVISEHTLTAGVGYRFGRFELNGAYQWNIPNSVHISQSALRSGEYSNSAVETQVHWFGATVSTRF